MLRVLHTGGANQEHFDLHHHGVNPGAICTSICTNSGANPGNLHCHPSLHKSDARECFNQEFEGVALGVLRG